MGCRVTGNISNKKKITDFDLTDNSWSSHDDFISLVCCSDTRSLLFCWLLVQLMNCMSSKGSPSPTIIILEILAISLNCSSKWNACKVSHLLHYLHRRIWYCVISHFSHFIEYNLTKTWIGVSLKSWEMTR